MSYIAFFDITGNIISSPWKDCLRDVVGFFVARIRTGATKTTTTLRKHLSTVSKLCPMGVTGVNKLAHMFLNMF